MNAQSPEPAEEYAGTAQLSSDAASASDAPIEVVVTLRGHFEPIDGRFHWYGRIVANPRLDERHHAGDTVVLTTPSGAAAGRISDVDPWGRFRIAGVGRPPF